ncbi:MULTISPECIES: adenosylcobinamide-phosphate synthase CbiB [unclassified Brenneria]|uniref:adenosylcobinamide-phosphate synthase CbiB n=1 Tax=unclassified Brenneria TaxID=2634434 RepID=UPI001554D228|nr:MULTISPECIES: adenosylcobinamide-phosphate synthase CbiB [unclassified Brenneria]MBJ7221558.1 cobalamin biosynthesis protein [Brenneria sp. L3-3C-1]MEE3642800.1 adenosylcobinamide-phosphate synthase CbiB [Brenneria sp. L3_3C_1]MEE3651018.1 adenosylcobinamide-phosphate synthase CbiB [Brenneria sp. HEZEL_4_2_4]NPD00973.1 cobalamin biosynthesis protein [Brenneria sp. hezel4-2-4]
MILSAWFAAFLLDCWLGDPPRWPHPVRWMGHLISWLQTRIRACCVSERALWLGGALLWLAVVGLTWLLSWGVLALMTAIHPWLGWLAAVWMIYTLLAGRCLSDAAMAVHQALQHGSLEESRRQLSWIVGRDTSQLEKPQMTRAVVETVAENSVDGVIAPLFFLLLGGVPLAMAYKAVNTLDSMVGYKNAKYRAIGFVSARMDDLANLIPARLSWLLLSAAAWLLRADYRQALRIGWRDRYQHSSPNCAWSEATVAGALGVRLGGPNNYFGERVEKPWIGDECREITLNDIPRSINLMRVASLLALLLFALTSLLLSAAFGV